MVNAIANLNALAKASSWYISVFFRCSDIIDVWKRIEKFHIQTKVFYLSV